MLPNPIHGKADKPCAMYFIVNIRSLIDTKTNSQDNNFKFRETTLNGIFKGVGFGKFSYVKVGHAIPHSKGLCTHAIFIEKGFGCCQPLTMSRVLKNAKYLDLRDYCISSIP